MEALNHLLTGASDILLSYGLQGVVMAALGYVALKLYKRNCLLQDARVVDAQTQTTALNANTAALQRISDALLQNAKRNT